MNVVIALIIFTTCLSAYGQGNAIIAQDSFLQPNTAAQIKDSLPAVDTDPAQSTTKPAKKYYPFELLEVEGHYQIVAQIEGPELYPKYYDFFQKNQYEGNGYCWEGHIKQILEKLNKPLLKHIDFDPEAGGFFATADSKANQIKFVELLSPIFSNLKELEKWVQKADRSKIDD